MNTTNAIKHYIKKLLEDVSGVKVLILDEETKEIVSVAVSLTEILKEGVFLIDLLSNKKREKIKDVKCFCLIRPTEKNVKLLQEELQSPKYQEYHLYFNNVIPSERLQFIAAADSKEIVKSVREYYCDYIAPDDYTFTLNLDYEDKNRICDGILSCLLSLKKRPFIRYDKNSVSCNQIAQEVLSRIEQESENGGLFDFKKEISPPILLILDRKDDPVTPLLNQWTYQAMVHELIGIKNNRIIPSTDKDDDEKTSNEKKIEEMILCSKQDSFFDKNMYSNWGDLCLNIKKMMDSYQQKHKTTSNISSFDDIRSFLSNFPEFKKEASTVDKHVTLVYRLKEEITKRQLLQVSKLEQEIVCGTDHSTIINDLKQLLPSLDNDDDCLKLVILYSLRYENYKYNEIRNLIDLLDRKGLEKSLIKMVGNFLKYAGNSVRNPGLFSDSESSFFGWIKKGGLGDVENVFTQHKPLLHTVLTQLSKLNDAKYPFISLTSKQSPKEVIIFMVGGITYQEAYFVNEWNKNNSIKVILGGDQILNSFRGIKFMKRRPINQEKANPKREDPELEQPMYEKISEKFHNLSSNTIELPMKENSLYQFLNRYKHLTPEEFDQQVSVNQFRDAVDLLDIPGFMASLDPNTAEQLYQEILYKMNPVFSQITSDEYTEYSNGGNPELAADLNDILYTQQLDFNPLEDFKLNPEEMQDLSAEEKKQLNNLGEFQFEDLESREKLAQQQFDYIEKMMQEGSQEIFDHNSEILNNEKLSMKEKVQKILRYSAIQKLGKNATEKDISEEILKRAIEGKQKVKNTLIELSEKEVEFFKAVQENDSKAIRLFNEVLPSLTSKFPGDDRLRNQTVKFLDFEKEMIHKVSADKAIQSKDQPSIFIDKIAGEKMWNLHKENPDFYTGERLGGLFGVTRQRAWAELIMREHMETEAGKFNYDKVAEIFKEERKKEKKIPREMSKHFKTEDEAYLDYLEIQKKSNFQYSPDENLSDFAKRPFQQHRKIEQEPQIQILENAKPEQKETEKSRTKIIFADIGKGKTDENRTFRVREKDGLLRSASWTEQSFLGRKRTFPKVKKGLGGSKKKKTLKRKRQF
eukprot:gene7903-12371_t